MESQQIWEQTKTKMIGELQRMSVDTLKQTRENVFRYFDFLEILVELPNEENTKDNLEKTTVTVEDCVVQATEHSLNNSLVPTRDVSLLSEEAHFFERKLKGGYISDLNRYVPESAIRKAGLEHGDYVRVTEKETNETNDTSPKRYYFELVQKGDSSESGRMQINYGLVEKDGHLLTVRKTILNGEEMIRFNETPHAFLIRDEEQYEHGIKEGDIVDIAFMQNNPNYYRVIWKHDINPIQHEDNKKKKAQKVKRKEESSFPEFSEENMINGKHVLVVGGEPRKTIFKQHIEECGGIFDWASGNEGKHRLKSMIQKADVVVILIRYMSHRGSQDTVEICKQLNIPFAVSNNLGIQTMLQEVLKKTTA